MLYSQEAYFSTTELYIQYQCETRGKVSSVTRSKSKPCKWIWYTEHLRSSINAHHMHACTFTSATVVTEGFHHTNCIINFQFSMKTRPATGKYNPHFVTGRTRGPRKMCLNELHLTHAVSKKWTLR